MPHRRATEPDPRAKAGAKADAGGGSHARIMAVVRRVPRGRVTTYGRVAELAGLPRQARLVGYALAALPAGSTVPWHRVVNAAGAVSPRSGDAAGGLEQQMRLEREGIEFDAAGRVRLHAFVWPDASPAKRTTLALRGPRKGRT